MRIAILLLLLALPARAIPPHVRSLGDVLGESKWVALARIQTIDKLNGNHGSGIKFQVLVERALAGEPPTHPETLIYWEPWPEQDPSGKMEAPIWTGSSIERKLREGDRVIVIASGGTFLRAEPPEQEEEIRRLLQNSQK